MGNLPFERNRYNPVQDVTPEEAEKNKQQMNIEQAIQDRTDEKATDTGPTPIPGQGEGGGDV